MVVCYYYSKICRKLPEEKDKKVKWLGMRWKS
jgi:hypothetical protein